MGAGGLDSMVSIHRGTSQINTIIVLRASRYNIYTSRINMHYGLSIEQRIGREPKQGEVQEVTLRSVGRRRPPQARSKHGNNPINHNLRSKVSFDEGDRRTASGGRKVPRVGRPATAVTKTGTILGVSLLFTVMAITTSSFTKIKLPDRWGYSKTALKAKGGDGEGQIHIDIVAPLKEPSMFGATWDEVLRHMGKRLAWEDRRYNLRIHDSGAPFELERDTQAVMAFGVQEVVQVSHVATAISRMDLSFMAIDCAQELENFNMIGNQHVSNNAKRAEFVESFLALIFKERAHKFKAGVLNSPPQVGSIMMVWSFSHGEFNIVYSFFIMQQK